MTEKPERDELELTEELFQFLQGVVPDGYRIAQDRVPSLSAEQAWTVVWFLQNQYHQYLDSVERCDVCGDLYDGDTEGACLDYGAPPYHFCEGCESGPEYGDKLKTRSLSGDSD